jgi:hypothetical protein
MPRQAAANSAGTALTDHFNGSCTRLRPAPRLYHAHSQVPGTSMSETGPIRRSQIHHRPRQRLAIRPLTWEPPWGVEPQTYSLRGQFVPPPTLLMSPLTLVGQSVDVRPRNAADVAVVTHFVNQGSTGRLNRRFYRMAA